MLIANRNHRLCGIVAAALSAAGCGVADTDSTTNGSAGRLAVAVTAAPEGAVCLSITVEGSRKSTQLFALTPGAGGQFELNGLPIGPVAVTGEVLAEPCAANDGKVPT